jgi:CheY-like chemotaxis protein/class 3 adenylate cyclase
MTVAQVDRAARILIVDDEPLNVDYLEQELESLGFVIDTASNGLEALERVAATPPDLVLLDVMMPELDGISALRILKEDPETRLVPVVLMTALNAVEDRVRGIEAGADDFLSKPVDDRELIARIKTALSLKRTIDETVAELRATSAYLERHGTQQREVAVLAVEWRLRDPSLPGEAVGFVGRSRRAAADRLITALGGMSSERDDNLLVAIFEGPDLHSGALTAVEAAFAVLGADSPEVGPDQSPQVIVNAGISGGAAQVGSTRVREAGEWRWVYGAQGQPVEQAADLAQGADGFGVWVAGDAASAVSGSFRLEPVGEVAYRVLGPRAGADDDDSSGTSLGRRIRTIVVTDVVDSTETLERVGDRAWSELVSAHDDAIRRELVLFGGEEVDTTGDGFIASFDSAARAIRCALAVLERVSALGLSIRAGIHTGEIEWADGRVRGIALHLASRITALAEPGEIRVSAATRELAAGAGLAFTDRGVHTLKGVSEPRRLYTAAEQP